MVKVIYWDLGGVCVTDNVARVFEEYGIGYGTLQKDSWAEHRVGKINSQKFFEKSLKGTGLEDKLPEIRERARNLIQFQPNGALPIIRQLHSQGQRQGILSNHSREWGDYILNDLEVKQYVDPNLIIISEQVGLAKPDASIYNLACALARVSPEEILFFDNKLSHVEAARKKAGFKAELFSDTEKAIETLRSYGIELNATFP